jgi:dipeptidase E
MPERHIVAMGGGGFTMDGDNPLLDDFVLSLARTKTQPRLCFVATASGDNDGYIARFMKCSRPGVREQLISNSSHARWWI